jgi:acetyl-CoA acetyltransferase family protein
VYRATLDRTGVEPSALGDIVVGSVLGPSSQRANEARIAMFFAGIPDTVPVRTVNRQCSSGLQAIADVAAAIRAGFYTVGLAAGVETMSAHPMSWEGGVNARIEQFPQAQGCLMPMGVTSENVAEKFGVDRATQDAFAAASHRKAAAAQAAGKFKAEVVPVSTKLVDPKTGAETPVVIDKDDGIRPGVTADALGGLKAVFKRNGTTTAGNSSQVTDGAAAVLLMTRREALRRRLPVLGVFRSFAAVGVDPSIMGVGPAVAIPAAVRAAGLAIDDVDVFEINEAFASQVGGWGAGGVGLGVEQLEFCRAGLWPVADRGLPAGERAASREPRAAAHLEAASSPRRRSRNPPPEPRPPTACASSASTRPRSTPTAARSRSATRSARPARAAPRRCSTRCAAAAAARASASCPCASAQAWARRQCSRRATRSTAPHRARSPWRARRC